MNEQARIRNITDLAKLAGVSPGTVSRALADSPLIAKLTRARIQMIAQEHDFRPNAMARNLRIKRAGAIGVLIPSNHESGQPISDPIVMALLGHLTDALTERGYDLLLSRVVPDNRNWLSRAAETGRVDGLILIGQSDQSEVIDELASRYLPLVVWGSESSGQAHCSVGSDNRKGGELATRHLIERGCRNFAFLGDSAIPELSERIAGCRAALAHAGLKDALTIFPAILTEQSQHPDLMNWVEKSKGAPCGIIAASDIIAMTALRVLNGPSISVPDDVRIVGYDDLPFAGHTIPPLTTIRQDLMASAAHLVDLLFRRIGGEPVPSAMIEPKLVVRQSG